MSPGKSSFLNFLRWTAALLVVVGHADMNLRSFQGIGEKWNSFGYIGLHSHAAVMIFFVLSGYVVSYATNKKYAIGNYGFRSYFLDRWSRIYSVLLPAIIFTLLIDYCGNHFISVYLDPAFLPQDHFVIRLFFNVFSLQGIQGYRVQLGSNPALWSIGYEFTFYFLYGLMFFRGGLFLKKLLIPVILLILVVIGYKMVVYFCIWLFGVVIHHATCKYRSTRFQPNAWVILLLIIFSNHFINYNNIFNLPELFRDVVFAITIACALIFNPPPPPKWQVRVHAYCADFSYSIYAFHMPLIFFMCSIFINSFQMMPHILPGFIIAFICILLARLFYSIGESRRSSFRFFASSILARVGL